MHFGRSPESAAGWLHGVNYLVDKKVVLHNCLGLFHSLIKESLSIDIVIKWSNLKH